MASKVLEVKRFTQIINQQMEILREETDSPKDGVDEAFSRVQREVDTWLNGGHVNQTTCAEMSNTIQQHIKFLIAKSFEISGPVSIGNNEQQASLTGKSTEESSRVLTHCSTQTDAMHCCDGDGVKPAGDISSPIVTMRLALLEEAVFSLQNTTDQVQTAQEKNDSSLKYFSTQQEPVNRTFKKLSDSTSKCQNILQEKVKESEKINQANSLNIETLKESVKKHDLKLNGFEYARKAIDISINELNKQLGAVKTLSLGGLVSLHELSKKVESTNEQNNEASDKMNKIENSINMMSSQYTEQFEKMRSLNDDKFEELKKSTDSRVQECAKKVSQIDLKSIQPFVGFYAWKSFNATGDVRDIKLFDSVECNYGGYFDQKLGTFTATLNGLYLISITIGSPGDNKSLTIVCKQRSL